MENTMINPDQFEVGGVCFDIFRDRLLYFRANFILHDLILLNQEWACRTIIKKNRQPKWYDYARIHRTHEGFGWRQELDMFIMRYEHEIIIGEFALSCQDLFLYFCWHSCICLGKPLYHKDLKSIQFIVFCLTLASSKAFCTSYSLGQSSHSGVKNVRYSARSHCLCSSNSR